MNESLYNSLLWDAKVTDEMTHPLTAGKGQCNICLQEAFRKCHKEHPEWFTLKTGKVRHLNQLDVEKYLRAVPESNCIIFSLQNSDSAYEDDEEVGICFAHVTLFISKHFWNSNNEVE